MKVFLKLNHKYFNGTALDLVKGIAANYSYDSIT